MDKFKVLSLYAYFGIEALDNFSVAGLITRDNVVQ